MTVDAEEEVRKKLAIRLALASCAVAAIAIAIMLIVSSRTSPRAKIEAERQRDPVGSQKRELAELVEGIEAYRARFQRLPTKLIELSERELAADDLCLSNEAGDGYLNPWGHPYVYVVDADGKSFHITSYGRDGKFGGAGDEADSTVP